MEFLLPSFRIEKGLPRQAMSHLSARMTRSDRS